MDETKELFNRIKRKDNGSFNQLTEAYGWKLYSYIRRSVPDREKADRIFNDTLAQFHDSAESYDCEDPIEAMLCLYADRLSKESGESNGSFHVDPVPAKREQTVKESGKESYLPAAASANKDFQQSVSAKEEEWTIGCGREFRFPDDTSKKQKKAEKQKAGKRSGWSSFLYGLCVFLLVVGILAALWFLVGILVDMEILPDWDLGYSWFNENVIHWF